MEDWFTNFGKQIGFEALTPPVSGISSPTPEENLQTREFENDHEISGKIQEDAFQVEKEVY